MLKTPLVETSPTQGARGPAGDGVLGDNRDTQPLALGHASRLSRAGSGDDFQPSRETAARTAAARRRDRALACAVPARPVRAMVATHPVASQSTDRSNPPRGRGFEPAPTARTAAEPSGPVPLRTTVNGHGRQSRSSADR